MALSDIEAVRLKTSDKATIVRETWEANGETGDIKMAFDTILTSPAPKVWQDSGMGSLLLTEGVDYTINYAFGIIVLTSTPSVNDTFEYEYYATVFTDEEIQFFLDESSSNSTLASAKVLLALAASDAKLARRETLSGGGGIGSATVDTSVRVRELRATAKALLDQYQALEGTGVPVEFITEIGWTDQTASRIIAREIIAGRG